MERMRFQSYLVQLKDRTPVFWIRFSFSRKSTSKLKYSKRSKFLLIVRYKRADLSNGGLFWKSLVPFFRTIYALSVCFKMKPLRKSVFQCSDKNQLKFCRKTCWKEQPFIFTVSLMNHIFQLSVLFNPFKTDKTAASDNLGQCLNWKPQAKCH